VTHSATSKYSLTQRVMGKAIRDMILDTTTSKGFKKIYESWFGNGQDLPTPDPICPFIDWPAKQELMRDDTWANILSKKFLLFAANNVKDNYPKRYGYVSVQNTTLPNYGTCEGFEADIAASVSERIGIKYWGQAYQAYFTVSAWQASYQDNIVSNMYKQDSYDFIMSGMSIEGKWVNPKCDNATSCPVGESAMLNRTDVLDFTCGYQDSAYGVVKGQLTLPSGVVITTSKDIDAVGVNVCVQSGTGMYTIAHSVLTSATIIDIVNGKEVTNRTLHKDGCHVYIAPIINAAWDGDTNSELTYIGRIGGSDGTLAIGIRKEVGETSAAPAAHAWGTAIMLLIISLVTLALF